MAKENANRTLRLAGVPRILRRAPRRDSSHSSSSSGRVYGSVSKGKGYFIVDGVVKKKATIKPAPRALAERPLDNHVYYYKVYPQFHLGPNKPWATTHSKLLLGLFRTDKEWRPAPTNSMVQFADYNSPIGNFCRSKDYITRKAFQAKLWMNDPALPPTLLLSRGKVLPLKPENQALWEANEPGKWYLKPSHEHGGAGIIILKRPQEALKYLGHTTGKGPKGSDGERSGPIEYVLQKGVEPLMLWKGHKFDLRTWVLVTYDHGVVKYYLYQESFIKVATRPYREESNDAYMNLTNLTYQGGHRGMVAKTIHWNSLPFYARTWEPVKDLITRLMNTLNDQWREKDTVGYEIMGFDIIFDAQERPYVLELNRYLGFPNNRNVEKVYAAIYQMIRDTMDLAVKPHIYRDVAPRAGGWVELHKDPPPPPAPIESAPRGTEAEQAEKGTRQKRGGGPKERGKSRKGGKK